MGVRARRERRRRRQQWGPQRQRWGGRRRRRCRGGEGSRPERELLPGGGSGAERGRPTTAGRGGRGGRGANGRCSAGARVYHRLLLEAGAAAEGGRVRLAVGRPPYSFSGLSLPDTRRAVSSPAAFLCFCQLMRPRTKIAVGALQLGCDGGTGSPCTPPRRWSTCRRDHLRVSAGKAVDNLCVAWSTGLTAVPPQTAARTAIAARLSRDHQSIPCILSAPSHRGPGLLHFPSHPRSTHLHVALLTPHRPPPSPTAIHRPPLAPTHTSGNSVNTPASPTSPRHLPLTTLSVSG